MCGRVHLGSVTGRSSLAAAAAPAATAPMPCLEEQVAVLREPTSQPVVTPIPHIAGLVVAKQGVALGGPTCQFPSGRGQVSQAPLASEDKAAKRSA